MELRQFVAESLRQIVAGVQDVQKEHTVGDDNRSTAPIIGSRSAIGHEHRSNGVIQFDVAVRSTLASEADGKASGRIGIKVVGEIEGEGGVSALASREQQNRLSFSVPITWPGHPGKW